MATEVGVGFVRLVPSMQGFSAAASKEMSSGLAAPSAAAGRSAGDGFVSGFGSSIQSGGRTISGAGDKLTLGLTAPLLGLGAIGFNASRDFNAGMANIATLIPGNTERIAEMKTGIRELSVEVGKSTTDMADGMFQVVSAFGDGEDAFAILDINARAATAGLATTTEAVNLTSAVTKGYGDTSAEAVQQASDLALLTVRLGQTDFPQLAASIGSVIPMASNLGVSQEELFASMATFTGVTGTASEVSTQMRGALQGLQAPTADAAKAIEEAGFASGAAAVEELGLAGAIAILTDASAESGKPLQSFLSSVEGQTFALGLAGAQAGDYERKLGEMANASGVTDEAFAEQTSGVNAAGFEWEQAKVKAEIMAQQLGDGLAPALLEIFDAAEPVIEKISELATQFAEADPETQRLILGGVGIAAALGPVASIVGRVTTAIGGGIRGIAAFARGAATVVKFGFRMATGLARAGAAFARLGAAAVRAGARVALAGARMALAAARATARVIAQIATQIARWVMLGIQSLLQAAKVALAWIISMGPIGLVIAAVIGLVALIIANWDTIVEFTQAAFDFVVGIIQGAIDWVKNNWPLLLAILTGPIGLAVLAITRNWDTIMEGISAVKDWISQKIDEIVSFFAGLPGRISGFIADAWAFLTEGATAAKDWVGDQLDDVIGFVLDLPGRITRALSGLAEAFKSPFRSAFQGIKDLWNNTLGGKGVSIPGFLGFGGIDFTIPRMHTGGIFEAVDGSNEGLALLESGEGVFTRDQMTAIGSGVTDTAGAQVTVVIDGNDEDLKRALRRWVRIEGGGDVQLAFGQR